MKVRGGHLYHAVGNCCVMCGCSLLLDDESDPRMSRCPGGPGTNVVAISHRIAEAKLAKRMDACFRYPVT